MITLQHLGAVAAILIGLYMRNPAKISALTLVVAMLLIPARSPSQMIKPWKDATSTDGVRSTLEHGSGALILEDLDGDGIREHLHYFVKGNPRILKRGPDGIFNDIAPSQLPEEIGRGGTWSTHAALAEDIDADGRKDLLFMPYAAEHPVRLYLSSGAGAPSPGRLWRAATDADIQRHFKGLHEAGRGWFSGETTPGNMKSGGDALLADFDGDGVKEIALMHAGKRASVYARPYIDAEVSGESLYQSRASAEAHYASRESRKYVYPGERLDYGAGAEVLVVTGTDRPIRTRLATFQVDAAYPYRLRMTLDLPQGASLRPGALYRIYRADRYQQKFFEYDGDSMESAARAHRGESVVADIDHDGREEIVVVDLAKAGAPAVDDRGRFRSGENANPYPGNPRLHVYGFDASQQRFVDWANKPNHHGAVAGLDVPQSVMAGRSLLIHDINNDGVDDIVIGQGPRHFGENVCYAVMNRRLEASAETRWGCPDHAPEGRIESSDALPSGTPGARILPEPPLDFRDRVILANRDPQGGLGFSHAPEGIPGLTENYGAIAKMFKISDRAGERIAVIRDVRGPNRKGIEVYDEMSLNRVVLRPACARLGDRIPAVISDAALDDVNADGFMDIAFNAAAQDFIFYGNAAGCFEPARVTTPLEATWMNRMASADFNRDGLMDFVGAMNADSQMDEITGLHARLVLGSKGKKLVDASARLPKVQAGSVFAGDLNGDGLADIFLSGRKMRPMVLLGDGRGTFRDRSAECLPPALLACNPGDSIPNQSDCHAFNAKASDINHDGRMDLILAGYRSPNRILFGFHAPGTSCGGGAVADFHPLTKPCADSQKTWNAVANAPAKCLPNRFVDAELELNANPGAGKILPVDNNGPNRTFQIAVGDFNGDSFDEVAVGSPSKTQGQTFTAMIYENRLGSRASAQFGPNRVRYGESWTEWFSRRENALLQADATPDQVTCLATGDITGDQVDDLLMVRSGSAFGARSPDQSDPDPETERGSEDTFDVDASGRLIYTPRSQAMVYAGTRPAGAGPSLSITKMRSQVLEDTDARHPGTRAFDCAVVNLDRDAFSDIIITGYGFGSPYYRPEAHLTPHGSEGWSLTYWMNDSSMTRIFRSFGLDRNDPVGRTLQLSMDEFPRQMMKVYSLGVGDLDGDRTPEIVLGTASQLRIFSQ